MGVMLHLDLPKLLAGMMGSPDNPIIGWIAHFARRHLRLRCRKLVKVVVAVKAYV